MRPWSQVLSKTLMRRTVIAICVIAVLWVSATVWLYGVMRRPPEAFGRVMMHLPIPAAFIVLPFETLWMRARAGELRVGDAAPDFTLTKLDKTGQVQLSSFTAQSKPVALVFGSYT